LLVGPAGTLGPAYLSAHGHGDVIVDVEVLGLRAIGTVLVVGDGTVLDPDVVVLKPAFGSSAEVRVKGRDIVLEIGGGDDKRRRGRDRRGWLDGGDRMVRNQVGKRVKGLRRTGVGCLGSAGSRRDHGLAK